MRLFPLLIIVFAINALRSAVTADDYSAAYWYIIKLPEGFIFPTWGNGAWSIAVELQFYVLMPVLLMIGRRNAISLCLILVFSNVLRLALHEKYAEVQFVD